MNVVSCRSFVVPRHRVRVSPSVVERIAGRRLAREWRVQCIIELIWHACLTYDVESHRIRRLAEEDLGLPYLRIETDYTPADSARIAVRVEALFETVRANSRRASLIR